MNKKKYLIVKGCAGLGNRLFTICSAIEYCKKTGRTLFVDWSDGLLGPKGENVFNEYFEIKGQDVITDWSQIPNMDQLSFYSDAWKNDHKAGVYDFFEVASHPLFSKIPKRFIPKGRLRMIQGYWRKKRNTGNTRPGIFGFLSGISDKDNFPFGGDLSTQMKADLLFFADFIPPYSEEIYLKHISLQKKVSAEINDLASKWGLDENTIGVNVRSTDKKPINSIEILFDKIAALQLRQPKIFLATDNKSIQAIFKERFPGLLYYERFLPEVSSGGLHQWSLLQNKPELAKQILDDSIHELWLLSKCQYLFYQGNSTFSILAKLMHRHKDKELNWDLN